MILLNGMQKEDFNAWILLLLHGMQKEDFNAWYY